MNLDDNNNDDNIMTDNINDQQQPQHQINDDDNDNAYELGQIYLNRWIDCQDEYNKWYEAQIIAIQPSNPKMIKVHYKGWKSKFDCWIDLNNEPERARLLHTFTDQPTKLGQLSTFDIGTKCDCLDSTDKWYQAEIMQENDNGELVRIHYQGWDEKYDEWINKDSYRIAPLHTMTSPTTITNTRSGSGSTSTAPKPKENNQTQTASIVASPSHKSPKRRGSGHNVSIKRKLKRNKSDNSNSSNRGGSGSGARSASYASSGDDHDTSNHNITVLSDTDIDYKNNTISIEAPQSLAQTDSSPNPQRQTSEIKDEDNDDDDIDDANNNNTTSKGDEAQISSEQYLRNFKPSLRDEQQFVDKLAVKGLQIVSMGEDGNCLFRSISHQVYGKEDYHAIIRQKCVSYLQSEYEYFSAYVPGGHEKQTFDAYCTRMLRSGVWGDNLEIQAFSEIYGRSIEIYAYDDKPMKTFSNQSSDNQPNNNGNNGNNNNAQNEQQRRRPPIRLSYHCNSHYNSIINPQLHRMNLLSESKVGEVEDERIRLSYLRSVHANQNTMLLSDVEATDLAYFQQALKESRQMFEDNNLNQAVGNQQLDEAIKKSLAQYEKDALDQAMQDSMKDQENQEDMELRKALELSQMDYFGGNDNNMLNDPNGNFDPNNNGGLGGNMNIGEYAVKVLVDKGYSLEQATMVWTVFEPQKDNFSQDVLIQKMIDYIQNITYSQNWYNLQ